MKRFAPWLFGSAAIFNFLVGVGLFLPLLLGGTAAQQELLSGPGLVYFNFTAGLILVFGIAYVCIAVDPVAYRPFIWLGALGKAVAVVGSVGPWAVGANEGPFPYLVLIDLVYIVLFLAYMRLTRQG